MINATQTFWSDKFVPRDIEINENKGTADKITRQGHRVGTHERRKCTIRAVAIDNRFSILMSHIIYIGYAHADLWITRRFPSSPRSSSYVYCCPIDNHARFYSRTTEYILFFEQVKNYP